MSGGCERCDTQSSAARADSCAVVVRDVSLRYRHGGGVGPVSFSLDRGCVLGLAGENGAGKTTLLRMVCGLAVPQTGSIDVWGQPVTAGVPPAGLGAIIEEPRFFEFATGVENLAFAAAGRHAWLDRIDLCLETVDLAAGTRPVREYSQGMRQRLGLARALLGDPSLLVLDEPANGLDPPGMRWLRELIRGLARSGTAVMISSHLLTELGRTVDTAIILRAGSVLRSLSRQQLAANPDAIEDAYFAG